MLLRLSGEDMISRRNFIVNTGILASALALSSIPSNVLAKPSKNYIFSSLDEYKKNERFIPSYDKDGNMMYWLLASNYSRMKYSDVANFYQTYNLPIPSKETWKPSPFPQLAFCIIKVVKDDADLFVTDPNRHYKDNCLHFSMKEHFSWHKDWASRDDKKLLFGINVLNNKIAKNSRRGRGNNIIVSTNTFNRLKPYRERYEYAIPFKNLIIDDDFVSDNEIFSFYKGSHPFDRAGVMFEDGSICLNKTFDDKYAYAVLAYIDG
jgi:hypothetical protein